jgi:hypothetical protein
MPACSRIGDSGGAAAGGACSIGSAIPMPSIELIPRSTPIASPTSVVPCAGARSAPISLGASSGAAVGALPLDTGADEALGRGAGSGMSITRIGMAPANVNGA